MRDDGANGPRDGVLLARSWTWGSRLGVCSPFPARGVGRVVQGEFGSARGSGGCGRR